MPDETIISRMLKKGVKIPAPQSVEIGAEIDPDRISGDDVTIHAGCKIFGESTLILRGARLGYEAPTTVENCFIGPNVELKGGFFKKAVFLDGAGMGSGAHVREGTIFEEQANGAHTVGLKQTILFPFVTLGSLINFCDCFMSGGTSRKDHSEVGSSYIHFNYTPDQHKATASLMGDVPRGVMLNQPPIFLGGQGGLVGPCRLAFGTVIAAGTVYRRDELRERRLLFEGGKKRLNIPFSPGVSPGVRRIIKNNLIYIANLNALMHWYVHVRALFIDDGFPETLYKGLTETLTSAIEERIKRLRAYWEKIEASDLFPSGLKTAFAESWPGIDNSLRPDARMDVGAASRDVFLQKASEGIQASGRNYLAVIQHLDDEARALGAGWLQDIVNHVTDQAMGAVPGMDGVLA